MQYNQISTYNEYIGKRILISEKKIQNPWIEIFIIQLPVHTKKRQRCAINLNLESYHHQLIHVSLLAK